MVSERGSTFRLSFLFTAKKDNAFTHLYFSLFGKPPTYSEMVWKNFTNFFQYIFSFISALFSYVVYGFRVLFSSPEFVGVFFAVLTVIIFLAVAVFLLPFLIKYDWGGLFRQKGREVKRQGSIKEGNKNRTLGFEGHDGSLLKSITVRNASTVDRLQSLLDAYESPTESNKLKVDLILQILKEETGMNSIPKDDKEWSASKCQKVWQRVMEAILAMEIHGTSLSPRDVLRKAVMESKGLNTLQLLEKSKNIFLSLREKITETEAMEVVIPRLGFQFAVAVLCDINFDSLTFDLIIDRTKNYEKLLAVCQSGMTNGQMPYPLPPTRRMSSRNQQSFPPRREQGGNQKYCPKCRRHGHTMWECTMRNPPSPPNNCKKCGQRHWISDCPIAQAERERQVRAINEMGNEGFEAVENPRGPNPFDGMPGSSGENHENSAEETVQNQPGDDAEIVGSANLGVGPKMTIPAKIESGETSVLCDSGATLNAVSLTYVKHLGKQDEMISSTQKVGCFNGSRVPVLGTIALRVTIGETHPCSRVLTFYVFDHVPDTILGSDGLKNFGATVDCGRHLVQLDNQIIRCFSSSPNEACDSQNFSRSSSPKN